MNAYETTATVDAQGQVRLVGLPFAPGTEVEVVVSPRDNGTQGRVIDKQDRVAALFTALDKARNSQPLGKFEREEVYDRGVLH